MHFLVMTSLLFSTGPVAQRTAPRDSGLARTRHWAALDQRAVQNFDSALVLLQGARRADPTYLAAQLDYIYLRRARFEDAILRHESVALKRSTDARQRCLGIVMAAGAEFRNAFAELLSLERSGHGTPCSTASLAMEDSRHDYPDSLKRAFYARAIRLAPPVEQLYYLYSSFLAASSMWPEAERVLEQGEQAARHPMSRAVFATNKIQFRISRGDTASALALERSIRAALDRDGRPGVRSNYEGNLCFRRSTRFSHESDDVRRRRVVERPRLAGDWAWLAQTLIGCGHEYLDHGDARYALWYLTRAVTIADSVRLPDLYLALYVERARAYIGLGQFHEAERDLRRALVLGASAGYLYNVAQAHHQLAHLHESAGRWREANRESEQFISVTRGMRAELRFTSLLDAGEIRWKSGLHASARATFEELVRVTDERRVERYWAGAYYERTGDLERARRYYRLEASEKAANIQALNGLVRVYEKLGQLDSAEAVARVHDSREVFWTPLASPLLPAILARKGRSAEAIRIARAWAARQEERGNVHGAAVALLHLARLALDARSPDEALVTAARAESLSTTLHLANELVRAIMLRGRAQRQLGAHAAAVTTLRRAALLARDDSSADNLLDAHLALGDALAGRGETDAALEAYDHAAAAAEKVTESLFEDLDRARYRDRHLLPFDGAVWALLREPNSARINQLVAWSARRKATALALAIPWRVATARTRVSVADLQGRLSARDALLDYLVLDSAVAVIVITREHSSVVRLPVSRDSLAAMVERLRRPLVAVIGGRIDLARARYSLTTAAALHAVLVQPLAGRLAGKDRIKLVPDGPMHALSFDALVVAAPTGRDVTLEYASAKYLIDAHEIEYLPSSSFLATSARPNSLANSRLLVVSYGAPGAEREAAILGSAWAGARTTLLAGAAATEGAIMAAMPSYGIVHFVAHAQASVRDPLASHLRLVADSLEDGYLNVSEIAATKINARLVVLSACETDAGPIFNGEGVMGLARAFLASGSQAVIGTQWPVGPTMAELMGNFYRRLAVGEAPSPALRAAKLAMRAQRETAHPFYWAGTVLVAGGGGR